MVLIDKSVLVALVVMISLLGAVSAWLVMFLFDATASRKTKKQSGDVHLAMHQKLHDSLFELLIDYQLVHGLDALQMFDTPVFKVFDWSRDNTKETNHDIPHAVFSNVEEENEN